MGENFVQQNFSAVQYDGILTMLSLLKVLSVLKEQGQFMWLPPHYAMPSLFIATCIHNHQELSDEAKAQMQLGLKYTEISS